MMIEGRRQLDVSLDNFQYHCYSAGWDAAVDILQRMADQKHNEGNHAASGTLQWAADFLRDKGTDKR